MKIQITETIVNEYEVEVTEAWPEKARGSRDKAIAHLVDASEQVGFETLLMKRTSQSIEREIDGLIYDI